METVNFKFALGVRARDRVTGQIGILDMRAQNLNDCIKYLLQPPVLETDNTKRPESFWIDEQQLEKIDDGLNENPVLKSTTGGPVERSSSARM